MPGIKASSIRDLKDRIGIYDVVSREVSLKKSGSNYKGLSPFNNEKTPSFYVSPDKGIYKCFSSGKAGDIISFAMETERLSFVEAVEALAQRFGFELEYEAGGRPREDRSLRQDLFELHEFVADYYNEAFNAQDEGGDWIRDYWTQSRQFNLSVAEEFKIGFAPVSGAELGRRVVKHGFSKETLEACGLFYTRRGLRPESMGYRFRGRLMIPIRDHQGRITAFTARQLELTPDNDPSKEAKYVNSPETPIFNKGSLLFNMDRARMEVGPDIPFVMVEGQLDAIRCWSVGLKGAVAPQGTGITESQLRLIKRYEPKIRCLLDGDRAGQQAALRMLPIALAQSVEVTFIPLNEGEDPDDLFRDNGSAAIANLLERETEAIAFATASIAPDKKKLTPQAKAKAARELFQIIAKADTDTAQLEFVKLVADELNIDQNAAILDFQRFSRGQTTPLKSASKPETVVQSEPSVRKSVHTLERDLLGLCINEEVIGAKIAHIIDERWIDKQSPEGQLLNQVLNDFLHDMWNGADSLNDQLEESELKSLFADLIFQKPEYDNPTRLANESIRRLVTKFADQKIKKIKLEIARKQSEQDPALISLFDELINLQKIKGAPPQLGTPKF
ncbi:MAG: DNA primase [Opitutaceae bacterium]|nr:DNA primase [Opitutaceae bacterium]